MDFNIDKQYDPVNGQLFQITEKSFGAVNFGINEIMNILKNNGYSVPPNETIFKSDLFKSEDQLEVVVPLIQEGISLYLAYYKEDNDSGYKFHAELADHEDLNEILKDPLTPEEDSDFLEGSDPENRW